MFSLADGDGADDPDSSDLGVSAEEARASRDMQQRFGLPPDELLHETFVCALQQRILHQGKLYLSQHFLCFHSSIPLIGEVKLVVRSHSIARVELAKVGFIFPTAIRVFLDDAEGTEHLLASFLHRERAFALMQQIVAGERIGKQRVKSKKQMDVDLRILERGAASASAAAAASANPHNHQLLLDKRAERLRQSKLRQERQEHEQQEDEEDEQRASRRHSGGASGAKSARTPQPAAGTAATPAPAPTAEEEEEDDALSMFRKPVAGVKARSTTMARRAAGAQEDEEAANGGADGNGGGEDDEPAAPARSVKKTRRKPVPPPEEEAEDAADAPVAASSARSATKRGAASNDLLVAPDARATDGPVAPHSAPHATGRSTKSGRKPSGAADADEAGAAASHKHSAAASASAAASSSSARKVSAAAASSDDDDDDENEDEFGSDTTIFDPIATYKLPDPRVTRIAARFRDLATPLDARNRRLLHQGFCRRQGKLSAVDRWLFLFTDCLLFAKIVPPESGGMEERYELKQRVDLANIVVDARPVDMQRADPNVAQPSDVVRGHGNGAAWAAAVQSGIDLMRSTRLPNVFRLTGTSPEVASFVISVFTPAEQRVWLGKLQFAIARHMLATGHPATTTPHNDGWWLKPVRGTLHQAAFEGDLPLLRALLKADPSSSHVNARLEHVDGRTALHLAVQARRGDVLEELLAKHGADQTVQDRDGCVPLHIASRMGDAFMVRTLLAHVPSGVDYTLWHPSPPSRAALAAATSPRRRHLREQSALWLCVLSRQREWQTVLSLLLSHAASSNRAQEVLDDRDDSSAHTLLEECVLGSLAPVVSALLAVGAGTELPNAEGLTPLGVAIQLAKDDLSVIRALVDGGAQLNFRRRPALSAPVHEASTQEQALYLIEHGGRPKMSDGAGRRKLVGLFDRSDAAQQGLLDDAVELWALKPILLTNIAIKLPPAPGSTQGQANSCQICADEFVQTNSVTHKRRRDYCRCCGQSVCGACSAHKLAFPLHKSGARTTKPPPVLPESSAAGGASTFAAPPPQDSLREVAPVCDGCYNKVYARGSRLRKERRKKRKARASARAAAEAEGEELAHPVSDEHDSEKESEAEGALYDGVEAAHHSAAAAAALARYNASAESKLGAVIGEAMGAVTGAAEGVLAFVGAGGKRSSGAASGFGGGGVRSPGQSEEEGGGSFASQASRAFDKLADLVTSVHVSQAPPRIKQHARNASQLEGPAMAIVAGSTPAPVVRQTAAPAARGGATAASLFAPGAASAAGGSSSRDTSQSATPSRSRQGSDDEGDYPPRQRAARASNGGKTASSASAARSSKASNKKERREYED